MKTIVIGDIHGRGTWMKILKQEYDKVIFLGDYLDTHEKISKAQQLYNFKEILNLDSKRHIRLIGNHDYHYLDLGERYSGYQPSLQWDVQDILKDAIKYGLLQLAYEEDNNLFIHAGLSQTWIEYAKTRHFWVFAQTIVENLNEALKYAPEVFKFRAGKIHDPYGNEPEQGPLWIRPEALDKSFCSYYRQQFVGHTVQDNISFDGSIWLCDALMHGQYIIIENGDVRVEKL
jgi:hypothetical protein